MSIYKPNLNREFDLNYYENCPPVVRCYNCSKPPSKNKIMLILSRKNKNNEDQHRPFHLKCFLEGGSKNMEYFKDRLEETKKLNDQVKDYMQKNAPKFLAEEL